MTARVIAFAGFLAVVQAGPALSADTHYRCSGGTRLIAAFCAPTVSPGQVVLTISGSRGKITLPQALSADGGRYASDAMEFWIKGRDATFTRASKSETCRAQ